MNTELAGEMVEIVGQVRDSYIVMESQSAIYYADQHALAERIAFEKMRKQVKEQGLQPEILLQPLTTRYPQDQEIDEKIQQLATMGFDIADFGENKVIVYAVPKVFVTYKMDIDLLLQQVRGMEELSFDLILDEILGMKACKASIKAGQKLSKLEMKQLIDDGMRYVEGMFVCQHGRPSVVKIEKKMIEGLFDR
ncbi:MAG: hypothetical protein H6765_06695 [Candidatus Peribacteria bacterium]|nr:MAG: hypothetical protein H6765_06695 [Candidatus Peribacteria bacterium]